MKIELTFSLESAQYLLSLLAKLPIQDAAAMWASINESVAKQEAAAQAAQAKEVAATENKQRSKRKPKAVDEAKS